MVTDRLEVTNLLRTAGVILAPIDSTPPVQEFHLNINPPSAAHGDTIRFHRDLYDALHRRGFSHPEISAMSVRAALYTHYSSPSAVDAHLGEGTYHGVKQRLRDLGSWRKQWRRAVAEHEDEYLAQCVALDHLREAARHCQQLGVRDQDIRVAFHTALTPSCVVPLERLPQLQHAK